MEEIVRRLSRPSRQLETCQSVYVSHPLVDHSYVHNSGVTVRVFCDALEAVKPGQPELKQQEIDKVTQLDGCFPDHLVDHSYVCFDNGATTSNKISRAIAAKNSAFQPKIQQVAVPYGTIPASGNTDSHCGVGDVTKAAQTDKGTEWDEGGLICEGKESSRSGEDVAEQLYLSPIEGFRKDVRVLASDRSEQSQDCGSADGFETVNLPGHLIDHSYVYHDSRLLPSKQVARDPVLVDDNTKNKTDTCDTAEERNLTVSFSVCGENNSEHRHEQSSQVSSGTKENLCRDGRASALCLEDGSTDMLQLTSDERVQGYNCKDNVLDVSHLPNHVVDQSCLSMDCSPVSDTAVPGAVATSKVDVQVSNQSVCVCEPGGTMQISSQNGRNIHTIVSDSRQSHSLGDSVGTHSPSESSELFPGDCETKAVSSVSDDTEHGYACRRNIFESLLANLQFDHSYVFSAASTTSCEQELRLNVGENADKDSIEHENLKSSSSDGLTNLLNSPTTSDECRRNELMRVLQQGVCEDFSVVSSHDVQQGSTRKRLRKMACPYKYAPRNLDLESRLPPGTVDCIDIFVDAIPCCSRSKHRRQSVIQAQGQSYTPRENTKDQQNRQISRSTQTDHLQSVSGQMPTASSRMDGEADFERAKSVQSSAQFTREEEAEKIQQQTRQFMENIVEPECEDVAEKMD